MNKKSLFWSFYTEQNRHPSIIFGTIHLSMPETDVHWDRVKRFIDQYPKTFTESSLSPDAAKLVQPFSLLPDGIHHLQYVSQRRWDKMREVFKKYCDLDLEELKIFRPLFILTQIQLKLLGATHGFPLDQKIWSYAKAEGKQTYGIESPEEQVKILQSLTIEGHYRQLVRMSKSISRTRVKLKKLISAYKEEDIQQMYRQSKYSLGKDRSLLLIQRNEIIAQRVFSQHQRESSFFTFGAGHLYGGKGVLKMLKHYGANVSPLIQK